MSKVIFKVKAILKTDELDRLEDQIKKSFEKNGFIIADDKIDVIVLEDGEDDK